jgi:hypothetical protein
MPTGTGLDAQLMVKLEAAYGTPVTTDKAYEFNSESLAWEPTWLEPSGLRVGTKFKRASRLVQSRQTVSGSIELEHATRLMGTLWKLALGSSVTTPTQISTTTAYSQIHTPGDFLGKSATIQVGRPEPSGTVRAHTYAGCKVSSWEFSCSDGEYATLSLDIEGRSEATATALATASYVAGASAFNFSQVTVLRTGGTASTSAGETTIAGGVAVPGVVTGLTISGENPMATERYGLGNAGLKSEPLENDIPTVTGTLSAEWDRTTFYDAFKNNATTALEVRFVGAAIGVSGQNDTLSFILPAVKFKNVAPSVSGPDVISADVDFEAYSDETNPVIQVKLISADSTAL